VRTSVTAAGIVAAAALVLTGCGSDDPAKDSPKGKETAQEPAAPSPDAGDGGGEVNGDVTGAWSGTTDGKRVDLVITGKKAALSADGRACTGEVADHGKPMLSLKCADGNKDRTMGTIESNDGKTLVVSWDAGLKDTLAKSTSAKLPEGIPTGAIDELPKLPGS
ncbi:hypothetical protein ACWF94_25685, partial [Streptomyces sp. NPDC055078]